MFFAWVCSVFSLFFLQTSLHKFGVWFATKKLQKKPDTIQEVAEETQKKKWSPPAKKIMVKAVSVQTEDVEKSPSPPPEEEVEPIELETRETQVFWHFFLKKALDLRLKIDL